MQTCVEQPGRCPWLLRCAPLGLLPAATSRLCSLGRKIPRCIREKRCVEQRGASPEWRNKSRIELQTPQGGLFSSPHSVHGVLPATWVAEQSLFPVLAQELIRGDSSADDLPSAFPPAAL